MIVNNFIQCFSNISIIKFRAKLKSSKKMKASKIKSIKKLKSSKKMKVSKFNHLYLDQIL